MTNEQCDVAANRECGTDQLLPTSAHSCSRSGSQSVVQSSGTACLPVKLQLGRCVPTDNAKPEAHKTSCLKTWPVQRCLHMNGTVWSYERCLLINSTSIAIEMHVHHLECSHCQTLLLGSHKMWYVSKHHISVPLLPDILIKAVCDGCQMPARKAEVHLAIT